MLSTYWPSISKLIMLQTTQSVLPLFQNWFKAENCFVHPENSQTTLFFFFLFLFLLHLTFVLVFCWFSTESSIEGGVWFLIKLISYGSLLANGGCGGGCCGCQWWRRWRYIRFLCNSDLVLYRLAIRIKHMDWYSVWTLRILKPWQEFFFYKIIKNMFF